MVLSHTRPKQKPLKHFTLSFPLQLLHNGQSHYEPSLLDSMLLQNANGLHSSKALRLPSQVTTDILHLEENFTPFHRPVKFLWSRYEQNGHGIIVSVCQCVFHCLISYLLTRSLACILAVLLIQLIN